MTRYSVLRTRYAVRTALAVAAAALVGCQQKMAEQPSPRPQEVYARSGVFAFGQSSRPLPGGTVFRGQMSPDDPMVTWLTPEGKNPKVTAEWQKATEAGGNVQPTAGAPTAVGNFVSELPFEMTPADLHRGQQRYNVFCALCHGAAGNGWGKIVERGFLRPPSYHQDADDKAFDWSSTGQPSTELKQGYSRGFFRYGIKVPLDQVPVGYIYQVISWGYGGMGEYGSQIPVEDRWRIVAYIRALQLSQGAKVDALPPEARKRLDEGPKANADGKKRHDRPDQH